MTGPGGITRSESPTSSVPGRRQRAPTITIDTSAAETDSPISPTDDCHNKTLVANHSTTSLDDKTSRPASAHNVSSPTTNAGESNYLAVPSVRSRNNSVDSEDSPHSPTSYGGETIMTNPPYRLPDEHVNNESIMNDPEALKADPGTEMDFQREDNRFAFNPGQLTKLLNPKSHSAFFAVGGLVGLERGLRSDRKSGLSCDETHLDGHVSLDEARKGVLSKHSNFDHPPTGQISRSNTTKTAATSKGRSDAFADRKRIFQRNVLPAKKVKNILQLAWIAYNDKVLILLTIAAVISLALGLYTTFANTNEKGPRVDWVEGVAIMAAVIIVVVVGAGNDWQKERQFVKLNKKKEDRFVKVIRSGRSQELSVYDILVGDVVHLEPGDMIPVDGVFIDGYGVKCDESSATGESDIIKKISADTVYAAIEKHEDVRKLDPFILSGTTVTEGVGTFLVTAVGVNSSYGKILVSLREGTETTPLQRKLNGLAEQIAKLGGAAALLLFIILLIKFLAQLKDNRETAAMKGQQFLQILIVAITIVVVAVPEGLPLAVTLALAFATTRMLKDNNLVRVLRACETMGNATTVCSDKTGTLTQNEMSVVAGTIGSSSRFGRTERDGVDEIAKKLVLDKHTGSEEDGDDVLMRDCVSSLSVDIKTTLEQSIAVNSTAFEGDAEGQASFIGSKTETALLYFARQQLGMGPVSFVRSNANVIQFVPFDSGRKCMGCVVKLDSGVFRLYVKGASEILLRQCTRIVSDPTSNLSDKQLTAENLDSLNEVINTYATRSLRTIGLIYRDFQDWPPQGARTIEEDSTQAVFDDVFKDMILLAIVGIQDPLRPGVREAVATCQRAGVFVRMVTGDNMTTARAIATECGIYTEGGLIMEGPAFRKLSKTRMNEMIPRLQVLARSSPEDKRILVKRLKELGETVAVTGDGTNDAPALKTADVGFSMGIAGTEVAKEASAIILMDDNFASIIKAIMWGRAVNDSVKKFLQFQITVNITAVILAFVSAVSSKNETSVLTAVQLLWVNLIMDTFAALALATDPPTRSILDRKPEPKSAPLISVTMWKMIIGQSIYQLAITFLIYYGGTRILSYDSEREQEQLGSLVFNTFVWMQIFNQFNSRRLDNKFNIFEGITRNYFFVGINIILIAGQVLIIFVGGKAFSVKRLNGAQWAYSIVLGALSMPIAVIIRLIPDELFKKILPERMKRKKMPQVVISDEEQRFEWNQGLEEIREELTFLKRIRGGRLNALRFKLQHPREFVLPRSRTNSARSRSSSILPQTPNGEGTGYHSNDFGGPDPPPSETRTRRRGRSRSNSAFGPAAAMAGIVAGSIGGWSPIERSPGDGPSIPMSQPRLSSNSSGRDLPDEAGTEIHAGTASDESTVGNLTPNIDRTPSQTPIHDPAFGPSIDSITSTTRDKS